MQNVKPNLHFEGHAGESEGSSLSEFLEGLLSERLQARNIGELVDALAHHGCAVVLILFSIPSALPVPAAGYSTLLSIPLLILGFRFVQGKRSAWFPEFVRRREFDVGKYRKTLSHAEKWLKKLEKISKPRATKLLRTRATLVLIGVLIICLASSMALPIPGTNTLPAGGIFLIGFGLLEEDALFVGLGLLYSMVALCLTLGIIYLAYTVGVTGIDALRSLFAEYLALNYPGAG